MKIKYDSKFLSKINGISYCFGTKYENQNNEVFTLNQIHSNKVIVIKNHSQIKLNIDGDALITNVKNFNIGVKTADCVPILFADCDQKIVGAIHAGWRGTYNLIVLEVLDVIRKDFNISFNKIFFSIGPYIQKCCFEVGEEIWNSFRDKFHEHSKPFIRIKDKYFLDLGLLNYLILRRNGVINIDMVKSCTKCNPDYYSYRREKKSGLNQISNIKLN